MQDRSSPSLTERVKQLEIVYIKDALQTTNGNKLRAAKLLGITRQGLDKKLTRYKIGKSPKSGNKTLPEADPLQFLFKLTFPPEKLVNDSFLL